MAWPFYQGDANFASWRRVVNRVLHGEPIAGQQNSGRPGLVVCGPNGLLEGYGAPDRALANKVPELVMFC